MASKHISTGVLKPTYIVSACLAGKICRYDGAGKADAQVVTLVETGEAVAICPETLAGLPVPRPPVEIVPQADGSRRILRQDGTDLTEQLETSVQQCVQIACSFGCRRAILKNKSPTCGCGQIYDGTFSGHLVAGNGIFAQALLDAGLKVENR